MTINSPNPGGFQGQMSQCLVSVRNDFQAVLNINGYITAQGGATFLENVIQLSVTDAGVAVAAFGNHAALAAIYQGGAPGGAFNYMDNGQPLWGGN